jgi:cytochrome c oxidase subunit 4
MATHEHHEHDHSNLKPYYIVYTLLMIGLVATVGAAYHDFGVFGTPIAMLIATAKAVMVVWIFMHVREATPMIWVTIVSGLVGLSLGFIFLFSDYLAR